MTIKAFPTASGPLNGAFRRWRPSTIRSRWTGNLRSKPKPFCGENSSICDGIHLSICRKRWPRTLPHIITVSTCAQKDISRDFNIPSEKFSIIPNGINTDLFYPMPEIKREKNRVIVTNSADTPLKGLFFLLKSISEISKTRDIQLIVVGSPKKNGHVIKLIHKLDIGNLVTFTGRISNDDFVREYARATVAVVPSIYEGFGLPAGEAMACGIPVISTTGGALPEVVGDGGILIPPADPDALTRAILDVLDNPGLASKLGQAGYRRVQNHLTWKAAAQKTADVYRKVIHGNGRFSPSA